MENSGLHTKSADQVAIICYTDPLCCWSWAWQPQLDYVIAMLGKQASWSLAMGGLIPDWSHFRDGMNDISRPSQMGPVWMHAGKAANRPISYQLWHSDPPASSWPGCIAIKCAQLQSPEFGFPMLQALQALAMERGINIAKKNNIMEAAHLVADTNPLFSTIVFDTDFKNGKGQLSFQADLDAVKQHSITRFPTLLIRANGKAMLIAGSREATTIFNAIKNIAPGLQNLHVQ